VVSALAHTWRYDVQHEEHWRGLAGGPFLFMCWHEALLPLLWRHRGQDIALVVSEARDGQYLADFGRRLGYRLVRGSSTRGSVRALIGAIRELEQGHAVAMTPDGPRGPRRELKPGIIAAAQRTGAAILPLHSDANRTWRFRSWDRFMLPKPFARVGVGYGPPIRVGREPGDQESGAAMAGAALEQLTRSVAWPDAGETPIA
jgi:lysophospholipid acyltransferase (LPLAT)-like uncharacterized protein